MKEKIEQSLKEASQMADEAYVTMQKSKRCTLAYNLAKSEFYLNCGYKQALEEVLQMM